MSQSSKKSSAKLSSDVMATVTALFLEMDSDCNGWLSREELHEGLSRLGFRLSDTTAEAAFRELDKNMDGKITLDEFIALVSHIETTEPKESKRAALRRAFADFDENKDGFLSEAELLNGLKKAGLGDLTRTQIAKLTANLDTDGDGKINLEEFVVLFVEDC